MQSKITNKVLAVILSVILMLQMGMPAVYAEGSTPGQEAKTITAFAELAEDEKSITVPMGTKEEELTLPETVTAAVYGETTAPVDITVVWKSDKPFSSETADTFIYTAGLSNEDNQVYTLAEGVEMPAVTVTVTDNTPSLLTAATITASAADPTPVTELWVGTTQVVQSGGTVTTDTSGTGWSYNSATATLTLNGANITTIAHDGITDNYGLYYYGIYCYGDLNIVVAGDSTIDARAAADKSVGIYVGGNLSVSGSTELTVEGNWRGLFATENLSLSEAVTLSGIAESTSLSTIKGVYVSKAITVSDTANLIGIAKGGQFRTHGIDCARGNITVDSGATLTGRLDDGGTAYDSDTNAGVSAGYTSYYGGQVLIEGTLVARAGSATEHGNVAGLNLMNVEMIISGNGSVSAESGDLGDTNSTSYGVVARGTSSIQINAGGFRASGESCAAFPATTTVTINGTPVYYEVSANRDGSSATVCTDTETWNSTYNGQFGAYKYINSTTLYEVYINGTQVTRINRHDVLGDGTVSYLPAADSSPAQLTLRGASLTTLQLDGGTELALTGANTIGTVTNAGAVTVSGSGGLTLTGSLDCGSESLTVESGAAVTVQGTVTAGAVVNGGTLINEGTLILPEATTVEQIQAINLTGDGIVKAGDRIYLDGRLYVDGGDASGGLDLDSSTPTEETYYKTVSGYAIFTPATADPAANTKLELHGAVISTTSNNALTLPADAPVDIIVAGDSSLTAGGSGNVIMTNGQALSVTGSGDLILEGAYYGINVNGSGAVSIDIDGDLTFDIGSQPISTSGDITVSTKNITTIKGYNFYSGGAVSFTATEGDISLTTRDSFNGAVSGNSITLTANNGAVTIRHSDNAQGGYALNGTAVTVSALNDVSITTGRGGIRASSGAVSVTSQRGSIEMDCAMDQCVSASGTVTLNANQDITLNDSADYSTAISASGHAVDITAGGALSSASAYGFQTGALTIRANEVSIEGTRQDGIQASSVTITNTDGIGSCESVSITGTSSSDERAAIYSYDNITVKTDELFIFGKDSAKAIYAPGTVAIGDTGFIIGEIDISDTRGIDSRIIRAANGGDISSSGLALDINTPVATTYYRAGDGYVLFNPASGETSATVTLHNASINNTNGNALFLPSDIDTTIVAEGDNSLQSSDYAIDNNNGNITIQGDGTLNAQSSNRNGISCYSVLTITGGVSVTASDIYSIGSVVVDTTGTITTPKITALDTFTYVKGTMNGSWVSEYNGDEHNAAVRSIYGNVTLESDESMGLSQQDDSLTVTAGATLTIYSGVTLTILDSMPVTNSGTIVNNGTIAMSDGTDEAVIRALNLTGLGVVKVGSQYYTNEGVAVIVISGGLDLTGGDHSGATLENDGYAWDSTTSTLTLGNACVTGSLTLPDNQPIVINTTAHTFINGNINGAGSYHIYFTFTGTAPLTIDGGISGFANGDTVTVHSGAQVTVNGSISIGASGGMDGILNVNGPGTILNVSAPYGYAVMCDTVNIGSGASLNVNAGSIGVEALSGVNITGGSTMTAGCDYGVYIIGGKLTVDNTSKLITKGAAAPFCVVDTTSSKTQNETVSLPGTPSGTAVASVTGSDIGYGYTYWSLVPTGGSLSVADENSTPVTLSGAKTGLLTFAKASSGDNNNNDDSNNNSGGSSIVNYTLSFETNGGSKISNVSKENGTILNLANYKPTRDGYDFDGWYSDKALTTKVTSITLTKNNTVYAKWTKNKAQSENPFTDVSDSDYYHDAVLWAVKNGITNGTNGTTFSPDIICSRAQAVTIMWRAKGSPEPTSANCPFTDVFKDAYYYKAVLWAIEKGITKGTSSTTFSPNDTVTRSQSMTFLWRAAGEATSASTNSFVDVVKDVYYYNAVLWAVEKGITKGTSATSFSPDDGCTRAQIVAFLYRYMVE